MLEDTLVRFDVPYQVIGGTKFYERAEIRDAIAYLSVLANPADSVSLAPDPQLARGAGSATPRRAGCSPGPTRSGITPLEAIEQVDSVRGARRRRGQGRSAASPS